MNERRQIHTQWMSEREREKERRRKTKYLHENPPRRIRTSPKRLHANKVV